MKKSVYFTSIWVIAIAITSLVGCKGDHAEKKKMVEEANKKQAEITRLMEEAKQEQSK